MTFPRPDEVTQAQLRCSARLDEHARHFVGREEEKKQLQDWLDRRLYLDGASPSGRLSRLLVVSGSSGVGKTTLVARETHAWRERTGGHVWWLHGPIRSWADHERDLLITASAREYGHIDADSLRDLMTMSPSQVRDQLTTLRVVQTGTLVIDGVTGPAEVEHFGRLGFGRVVVTTSSDQLAESVSADVRVGLSGLSASETRKLLFSITHGNPELPTRSLDFIRIITDCLGNPQRLWMLLRETGGGDDEFSSMFTRIAIAPPVWLEPITVGLLCDLPEDRVREGLARLEALRCLQTVRPSGQVKLHAEVRKEELQRLQDDPAEWAVELTGFIGGLERVVEQLASTTELGAQDSTPHRNIISELFAGLTAEDTFRDLTPAQGPRVAHLLLRAYQRASRESRDLQALEPLLANAERFASGHPLTLGGCRLERGKLSAHRCDWESACAHFDAASDLASDSDDPYLFAEALVYATQAYLAAGHLERASASYKRCVQARVELHRADPAQEADRARLSCKMALLGVQLDYDNHLTGRGGDTNDLIRRLLELLKSCGGVGRPFEWDVRLLLIEILLTRRAHKDLDRAHRECDSALGSLRGGASGENLAIFAKFTFLRGVVSLHKRALTAAYEDIREAERLASELQETELLIDAQLYLVDVLVERRLLYQARALVAALLSRLEASPPGAPWEVSAHLVAARASRACGDLRPAKQHIDAAARLWSSVDATNPRPDIELEHARVLVAMGAHEEAYQLAEQVFEHAQAASDAHTQVEALIELLRMREGVSNKDFARFAGLLRALSAQVESPLAEWEIRRLEPRVYLHDERLVFGMQLEEGLREAILYGDESYAREVLIDEQAPRPDVADQRELELELERDALLSVFLGVHSRRRVPWILFSGSGEGGSYSVYDCARTKPFPGDLGGESWGDARHYVIELISTLQLVHWLGYCHGDLSPRNVRVTQEKRPVILGFSASRSEALVNNALARGAPGLSVGAEDTIALARMLCRWLADRVTNERPRYARQIPQQTIEAIQRIAEHGGTLTELQTLFGAVPQTKSVPWIGREDVVEKIEAELAPTGRRLIQIVGKVGSGRRALLRAVEERLSGGHHPFLRIDPPWEGQSRPLENVYPPLEPDEQQAIPESVYTKEWDGLLERLVVRTLGRGTPNSERATERRSLVVFVMFDEDITLLDTATSSFLSAIERRAAKATGRVRVVRYGSLTNKRTKYHPIELRDLDESELTRLFVASPQDAHIPRLAARALHLRSHGRSGPVLEVLRRWVKLGWATETGESRWRVGSLGLAAIETDPALSPSVGLPNAEVIPTLSPETQEVLALICLAGPGYPIDRLHRATTSLSGARVRFLAENALERHGLVRANHDRTSFMSVLPYSAPRWSREEVAQRRVKLAGALSPGVYPERRFWLLFQAHDLTAIGEAVRWTTTLRHKAQPEQVPTYVRVALMLLDRLCGRAGDGQRSPDETNEHRLALMQQWVLAAIQSVSVAELAHAISALSRMDSTHTGLYDLRRFAVAFRAARLERSTATQRLAGFDELDRLLDRITHPDLSRLLRFARLVRPKLAAADVQRQLEELRQWAQTLPKEERRPCLTKIESREGEFLYFSGESWEALWRYERHPPDAQDEVGRVEWLINVVRAKLELFDRLDEVQTHIKETSALLEASPSLARSLELDWVKMLLEYRSSAEPLNDQSLDRWRELEQRYAELLLHERLQFYWLQYAAVLFRCAADPGRSDGVREQLREQARVLAARVAPREIREGLDMVQLLAKALQLACGAPMEKPEIVALLQQAVELPNRMAAIEIFGVLGRALKERHRPLWSELRDAGVATLKPFGALLLRHYSVGARRLRRVVLSIQEVIEAWELYREEALITAREDETNDERLVRFFADSFTPLEISALVKERIGSSLTLAPSYTRASHRALIAAAVQELRRAGELDRALESLRATRPARLDEIITYQRWHNAQLTAGAPSVMTIDLTSDLTRLFGTLFDGPGLRQFLRLSPQGGEVYNELPGPTTGISELAFSAALILQRRGLITDELFVRLTAARPGQAKLICEVWVKFNPQARCDQTVEPPPPPMFSGSRSPRHRLKIQIGQGEWQSKRTRLNARFHCAYELLSDGRSGVGSFQSPWDEQELASIRARLRDTHSRPSTDDLLSWGSALRGALLGLDPIMGGLPWGKESIEFDVQLNHASLLLLPWELLVPFVGQNPDFVVLSKNAVLFRSVPRYISMPSRPLNPDAPVLFAWSDAGGRVPHEQHLAALKALIREDRLIEVPEASLKRIREAYMTAQSAGSSPTALHLLCHGAPVGATEYGLRLHDTGGYGEPVEALAVKNLLSTHLDAVSLFSLAACHGAEAVDWRSPVSSVAVAARGAGVDVVASQFPMSFDASVIVTEELYRSLFVRRQPLEIAHHYAVSGLYLDLQGTLDWASLVLMKAS